MRPLGDCWLGWAPTLNSREVKREVKLAMPLLNAGNPSGVQGADKLVLRTNLILQKLICCTFLESSTSQISPQCMVLLKNGGVP